MARFENTGKIPRILITEGGQYVRVAPGKTCEDIEIAKNNPVMKAYLADGGGIKKVGGKAKAKAPKAKPVDEKPSEVVKDAD